MKERDELELILKLIEKFNLPLSPILEYAIKEKMEEYPEHQSAEKKEDTQMSINRNSTTIETVTEQDEKVVSIRNDNQVAQLSQNSTNEMRIVEFGERQIAVTGDTRPHKDSLRAMGGFFMIRSKWGPIWLFPNKKRERIQAYIDGDISVVNNWEDNKQEGSQKRDSTKYLIRVKYPNGRVFCSNLVWETLVDVIKYAGAERVERLHIIWTGDNLVSSRLNSNSLYKSAQKDVGNGLYVSTHSSTDTKYKQIEKINNKLCLGLKVEKVYVGEGGNLQVKKDVEPYNRNTLNSSSRDRTKYSFEGGQMLSKRRFVLEVVKHYVSSHPNISYESLLRIFPASLHSNKSNGVIKPYDVVAKQIKYNPDISKRFFLKQDEIIELSNGMRIVVHNQWGESFNKFLEAVKSLYNVKSSDDDETMSYQEDSKYQASNSRPIESTSDKRIGLAVRLIPSLLEGEIVKIRNDRKGITKLVVRTKSGKTVEINDLPYLYEVLHKKGY